jgi:hypothetical protein
MIKKSFLNPGAYVIFIKSLKNDGLRWVDIGELMLDSKSTFIPTKITKDIFEKK